MVKIFVALIFTFIASQFFAQPGCTDPQALNFDVDASQNDGSCVYPITNYDLTQITELPETFNEASGIEFFSDNLWIHNDGGNENKI